MSIRITIKLNGLKSLSTAVSRRANLLGQDRVERILREEGKELQKEILRGIQKWKPGQVKDLTPAYKKRKQREVGYAYPILWKTGVFLSSMFTAIRRPGRGLGWGVRINFAGQHYSGLRNAELADIHAEGRGNNPARDFLKLPKGWNLRIINRLRAEARRGR